MAKRSIYLALFCLVLASTAAGYEYKKNISVVPMVNAPIQKMSPFPRFSTAEACTVRHDQGLIWLIQGYLTGMELYKSFQDPAQSCTGPYPFTVQDIQMILYVGKLCTLYVSVDVESADMSTPSCPVPGDLLSLSSEYRFILPSLGLYLLTVPLDSTVAVSAPYFAGFYFSDAIDTSIGAWLLTDSIPALCTGYNIWDTSIGYVDVCDLPDDLFGDFDFPGRLVLFSSGIPGGSGGAQPVPAVTLLKPGINEIVSGAATMWATESAGNTIIDYVRFDQRRLGTWVEIGEDADGTRALRNGVDPSGSGAGYTYPWDYSGLTEGTYWLKATIYDTLEQSSVDSHLVSIDPTPPDLNMTSPLFMDSVCLPLALEVTTVDEDVAKVKFEKKAAPMDYSIPVITLSQSRYGDADGDWEDGNLVSAGEYGDYYCGPVAGAIAIKYWFDMGFMYGMREGTSYISVDTVVERLAANMQTRFYKGTYDDRFYGGLQLYISTHGNELTLGMERNPSYARFRTLLEERELLPILALSGTPGVYVVASGVSGLMDALGRVAVKISDPLTGTIVNTYIRNSAGGSQVYYSSSWHDVDMIITLAGGTFAITRDLIGIDSSSADGWSFSWASSNMTDDSLYFITATATDATGRIGTATNLVMSYCKTFEKGDYNGDGAVNVGDVIYLIGYIYREGLPPVGGAGRADANCNGEIDISDAIYAIRYIYAKGPAPCY